MKLPINQPVTMDDLSAEEEFITAAEFEDATKTVVKTLGKNFNLDVVFAGNGAKTDGKTVYLPSQDPMKKMTKKQYAVGQGYANHETMHNLCSDMNLIDSEFKRLDREGKKLAKMCANAIEDVRIEKAAGKLYPGIPSQISSTADYAAKMFLDEYFSDDPDIIKDFKKIGPLAITWRGRQRMGYTAPYIDKVLDMLDQPIKDKLDKWCDLIDKLELGVIGPGEIDQPASYKGTKAAIDLAEILAREIEEMDEEEEEEEDDSNSGADGSNGEDDADAEDGGGAPSGGGGGGVGNGEPFDPSLQSSVAKLLSEGEPPGGWRPVSTMLDSWISKKVCQEKGIKGKFNLNDASGDVKYQKLLNSIGTKTAVMKRKLERALMTKTATDYVSGQKSGRLDVRRKGVNIIQGRSNVYRRKVDGQDIDTAVSVVVDASGSMGGSRMEIASQMCVALAEALEKTGVGLEVLAFTSSPPPNELVSKEVYEKYYEIRYEIRNSEARSSFHRADPVMMLELKSFGQTLKDSKRALGHMPQLADGGTTDGDAILQAAKRLSANSASKKIMVVLTDGGSAYSALSGSPAEYTKMAVNYCTKDLKINMVGVGIQSDSGSRTYKNWTEVNSLEDLDKAVIDKIAKLILGENFKVDNGDLSGAKANFKKGY